VVYIIILLDVFDDVPVCRHVTDKSWVRAVMWRVSEMKVSKDKYAVTI